MVFKRPTNSRDDRNGRSNGPSKGGDRKRSDSTRGSSSKSTDKSSSDNTKKRYSSGPSSDRGSAFSGGADKKGFSSRKPYSGRPTEGGDSERPKRGYGTEAGSDKKSFSPRNKPYSGRPTEGGDSERPRKTFGGDKKEFSPRSKPYGSREGGSEERPKKSFGGDKKEFSPRSKPYGSREGGSEDRPKKSFGGDNKDFAPRSKPYGSREGGSEDRPKKSFGVEGKFNRKPKGADFGDKPKRTPTSYGNPTGDRKVSTDKPPRTDFNAGDKPFRKDAEERPLYERTSRDADAPVKTMRAKKPTKKSEDDGLIRLNRYIANAGICSRRKADELIIAGVVSVNGVVINELGHKVDPMRDEIRYNGETLKREKSVYVLLNKPKDYITTTDDPQERRTVMHLVEKASRERIYPVGRLDRNTTGLLLMTNDGDLADKLSHPRSSITKIYHVELSKSLAQGDLNKLQFGLELEDGLIKPDSVSYVTGATKKEVGVQIHSGKNRIVRRMFEHLDYEVVKLDRVVYANLTKKDLPRGRWRYLDEKEVIQLKHLIK
ncbi:pseudouridine synthase [Mucilaginibacter antarcticus]|uniref:Pseudouridine synthase n=1 Tax=Mucilaginibacter antarcticus TaxID=1855725 RepID=A0ABW5XJ15_9SPHI